MNSKCYTIMYNDNNGMYHEPSLQHSLFEHLFNFYINGTRETKKLWKSLLQNINKRKDM